MLKRALKHRYLKTHNILYPSVISNTKINTDIKAREELNSVGELPSPLNPHQDAFAARYRRAFGMCTQLQPTLKYARQLICLFAKWSKITASFNQ